MTPNDAVRIAAEFVALKYFMPGNRVGIIMDEGITQTSGGIILGGGTVPKYSGTIVMVGNGVALDPHFADIRVSDRVLFNRYIPLAQEVVLTKLDGAEVVMKVMHSHDCYVGWRDEDLRKEYENACTNLVSTS